MQILSGLWESETNANPAAEAGASLHAWLRVLRRYATMFSAAERRILVKFVDELVSYKPK